MKKVIGVIVFSLLCLFFVFGTNVLILKPHKLIFQTGDIIYQSSNFGQSKAVKLATHSKYSHVGMVVDTDSGIYVLEAVQPIQMIPIETWIGRSKSNQYCLQRMTMNKELTKFTPQLRDFINKTLGKNYDLLFEWSDDKFYCSELVWKLYKEVYGIELSGLRQLKDFDLTHPYVKNMLVQRYGDTLPLEQYVVSPQDLYDSKYLKTIEE